MIVSLHPHDAEESWGAGVETQKNVRGEIGGWGRVPFNETYAQSFSTIYDGGVGFMKFLEHGTRPQPPTSDAEVLCSLVIYRFSVPLQYVMGSL